MKTASTKSNGKDSKRPVCVNDADPLLSKADPHPFEIYNPQGLAPLVIVSDHASRRVPKSLGNLGLDIGHFDRHIAYDIGADIITRRLADRLNARAVIAGYSRLVVDLNRKSNEPGCIPPLSDNTIIPANQNLGIDDVQKRLKALHEPYHEAIDIEIKNITKSVGKPPVILSIHSFTPSMNGQDRIWDVGVLWHKDPRIPVALMEYLKRWDGLCVGNNEPYGGKDFAFTIDTHGTNAGLANCAVEIRQDHCGTGEEASHWADILADAMRHILRLKNLHEIHYY